jgi:hypothetical protein
MTELLIVLATAALFVTFGLASRQGRSCPGPEDCPDDETLAGCAGCPSLTREDHHGPR